MSTPPPVLHEDQIQWLRQLRLPWHAPAQWGIGGERRAQRGRGNEPELLRRYQYGDDIRRIDWPATLRLQRPTVRQPQSVMPGRVQVVFDTSASMQIIPAKWRLAQQIGAAYGVIATAHADMVCAVVGEVISPWFTDTAQWLDWIHAMPIDTRPFRHTLASPHSQITVVVSDMWHDDVSRTIQECAQSTDHLIVMHVLSTQEITPEAGRELTLRDSERDEEITVRLTDELVRQYEARLATWRTDIEQRCRAYAADYIACHDEQSLVTIMAEVVQ